MDSIPPLEAALADRERGLIEQALRATDGNVTQAASLIQISRQHIYNRMRRLGIEFASFRVR